MAKGQRSRFKIHSPIPVYLKILCSLGNIPKKSEASWKGLSAYLTVNDHTRGTYISSVNCYVYVFVLTGSLTPLHMHPDSATVFCDFVTCKGDAGCNYTNFKLSLCSEDYIGGRYVTFIFYLALVLNLGQKKKVVWIETRQQDLSLFGERSIHKHLTDHHNS